MTDIRLRARAPWSSGRQSVALVTKRIAESCGYAIADYHYPAFHSAIKSH